MHFFPASYTVRTATCIDRNALATQDIVEEVVEQELAEIRQPKRTPCWLFETLKDNKLDAPLQAQTRVAAK